MAKLAFLDYHNMIAILEKTKHNIDFHQLVDFLKASHIRYALTINPTVYVSHIRQFWSTARIETTNQEIKILATVDGKPRTISESSLRRHLKLSEEEGISSLPDTELFENFSLMGYNILSNQRFTFQKGQFSPEWKFLIDTIMQCLSPKSTGFNKFSSNIATAVVCLATNRVYNFSKMIFDGMVRNINTPTEPITLRKYTRRAKRIAQSKALSPVVDEPSSLLRDDRKREAFSTVSSLDARQDKETINKTSPLPHESSPRVTSLDDDEGNQDLEISGLIERVKFLKDKDRGRAEPTQEDAPIKGGIMEIGEEVRADKSTELAASVSPAAGVSAASIPTVSGSFPTVSAIFTTTIVVAKEMEEEFAKENQRVSKKLARGSERARLHAEAELKMMIEGLDRSNEVIAKHLQEYEQAKAGLSVGEKIELINELVKYQDHHAKILKGMTLEQLKKKFTPVWKHFEDFVLMDSKEEGERVKGQGLKIDQGSSKRMKTPEDVSEEKLKEMMRLVPLEEVYVEALEDLHQLWTLVKETLSIKHATKDKEKELWVELKRLFEPDFEDQLWTHNQDFMHDPLEWKLYDTCGIHHVSSKD
nr:synaptobrevin, longin-like domain protein [Tanacetum cinerariifolium]